MITISAEQSKKKLFYYSSKLKEITNKTFS